jgi:phenylalanyl-tRNA synthetase beta chain
MKFPESWLREFVDPPQGSAALARALTMAGIEVESVEPVAPPLDSVLIGHVLSVAPHPNADRLRVCQVDAGCGAPLTIVCGAPNVAAGQRVPTALVGAKLPGIEIKAASIRGVASQGMLCSEKELGLSEESSGIYVLAPDAPVGQALRDYLELSDNIFTLKLTPNRGDCLGVVGVAREVAALTGAALRLPQVPAAPVTIDARVPVRVAAPDLCGRFSGRVIRGVNARAATPLWMRRRLERAGQRSISVLVDISNYVMLESNRPNHVFDLDKINGGLTVRWGKAGEPLRLLSEQTIELHADAGVIADEHAAESLAGIMGGAATACSLDTANVFVEAAFWWPQAIAGRARRYALTSEAGHRFERGTDFSTTVQGVERVTQLILEICGGNAGPLDDHAVNLPARAPVRVRPARVARVLGMSIGTEEIQQIFNRMGMFVEVNNDALIATPPAHRFDLSIEEDFIEEIARLHGYERIPAAAPHAGARMLAASERARGTDDLKRALVAREYQEIITYSFVEREWELDFAANAHPVPLVNPIASNMSVMRSSLLGGLIATLHANLNRKQERIRVFELGRCFSASEGQIPGPAQQPLKLAALAYGLAQPEQWASAKTVVDFFDVKGDLVALVGAARFAPGAHPALHPGRCAQVSIGALALGWIGELHPRLAQRYELPQAPVLFELEVQPLLAARVASFAETSRFPAVRRDIAFIADEAIAAQALLDTLRGTAPKNVIDIDLFDLYRGPGIEKGKKSLAFRVVMQDTSKTLADEEIEAIRRDLIASLTSAHDVQLRV